MRRLLYVLAAAVVVVLWAAIIWLLGIIGNVGAATAMAAENPAARTTTEPMVDAMDSPNAEATEAIEAFPWLETRVVFKVLGFTAHSEPEDVGYVGPGDDTHEQNEQTLRVQFTGAPLFYLDYQIDYLNVKRHRDAALNPGGSTSEGGAALFRYTPWRETLEEPEPGSSQTVWWYHEIDRAFARLGLGPVEATLGRQPISWGTGRFWQPTDLFAAFDPLALDTEYKPGVDAALLRVFPGDFSAATLAWVRSPMDEPQVPDSTVAHLRSQVGEESEVTAVAGRVREAQVAGGSLETNWLDAGWRLEALAYRMEGDDQTYVASVLGMETSFGGSTLLIAEWYRNTLGVTHEADVLRVAAHPAYLDGRLPQLSRDVLALGVSGDLNGLWNWSYTLLGAGWKDPAGHTTTSLLHQGVLRYSISDESEAVFSLLNATGKGLQPGLPYPLPRSEFGHIPASFTMGVQFVL